MKDYKTFGEMKVDDYVFCENENGLKKEKISKIEKPFQRSYNFYFESIIFPFRPDELQKFIIDPKKSSDSSLGIILYTTIEELEENLKLDKQSIEIKLENIKTITHIETKEQ